MVIAGEAESSESTRSVSPRLLFASYHCFLDPSSGAAISLRDMLAGLQALGWSTKAFTGPMLDFAHEESPEQLLSDQHIAFEAKTYSEGGMDFSVLHYQDAGIPATIFRPKTQVIRSPSREESQIFLALFERVLAQFQPDVFLTYGGQHVGGEMMKRARDRGIRVVFTLRNFAYHDRRFFEQADAVLVPSEFSADHYRKELGLNCVAIPSPIVWSRVLCEPDPDRRQYVTFVNPHPNKGVSIFARIAHELARRRPEIPLLVVEGRGKTNWLARSPLDLSGLKNLNFMANTPDPRDFYGVTRIMLMPSLGKESFGRVAAESLINGIPVLASDRGSLPEVLAEIGFLFDVPAKYTPQTAAVLTPEEVAPWIETLIRLWDDNDFYHRQCLKCQAAAQQWQPDRIISRHEKFFRELFS